MNKTINKKYVALLAALLIGFLFSITACKTLDSGNTTVYFFDNATFSEFTDEKIEEFVIAEDVTVHFTMRGTAESGQIDVKVYNKDNAEVVFENSDNTYDSEFDIHLTAGTYCYVLSIQDCTNGAVYNKAEIK